MQKNRRLLILLFLLVIVSIGLNFLEEPRNSKSFNVDRFQVPDTALINSIVMSGDEDVRLEKNASGTWLVNDRFEVNTDLRTVLLAVLNQVNVRRPVSKTQQMELAQALQNSKKISVTSEDGTKSFFVGGNPARTQSYFMLESEDVPYIVEIPGYRNYIAGIFDLTEMQWRDRTLFNTLWRSLQTLDVTYPNNPEGNLSVYFEDEFFKIRNVSRMDTTALMSYLSNYEGFEANEFIPQGFSKNYDSLSATEPFAVIRLNEINSEKNQELKIFPKLNDDNYLLTLNKDGEMSLVDFGRVRNLLVRLDAFRSN